MSKNITNLEQFEKIVLKQKSVSVKKYNLKYFSAEWRKNKNSYQIETRRKIESKNPILIKKYLKPKKVLDVGCGPGALMLFLKELGINCYGVDSSPTVLKMADKRIKKKILIQNVTKYKIKDKSFDLVICREMLEHLTVLEIKRTVKEVCRISSNLVYVTTRFHNNPKSLYDFKTEFNVDPTHISCLNQELLRLMFVLEGFKRRKDLENKLDWLKKGRVLIYQKQSKI